jgi:hypothetical protein
MDLFKLPGIAETIDWTEALMQLDVLELTPERDQRHARRAAQVSGRHRPHPRQRGGAASGSGQGRDRRRATRGVMAPEPQQDGRLVANLMHFARTLRAAGLPVGPGKVIDAVVAVRAVGITNRADFYWTLHAVFVNRPDQRPLFDQAFHVFWRNPELLKKMMSLILPEMSLDLPEDEKNEMLRRLAEALHPNPESRETGETELEFDAAMTFSDREQLQTMDFEKMSLDELAKAKAAIARLKLPVLDRPTRRFAPDPRGARADMRATLRAALRSGGIIELKRKSRKLRPPPLVVLCDISGSMSRYSRMFLHFMHAITNDRDRVFTFVFGTRLTNITRYLRFAMSIWRSTRSPKWSPTGRAARASAIASSTSTYCGHAGFWARARSSVDHRRARPRCRNRPRARDGSAAPFVPPADLAQSPVALRGVRAKIIRDEGDVAACRRIPSGAQPRKPRKPGRGAERAGRGG